MLNAITVLSMTTDNSWICSITSQSRSFDSHNGFIVEYIFNCQSRESNQNIEGIPCFCSFCSCSVTLVYGNKSLDHGQWKLRSESLILVNISNKVKVQKPWACLLNVSGYQGQMPWSWFLHVSGYQGQVPDHGSLHRVRAQGQTNCLFDKLHILWLPVFHLGMENVMGTLFNTP